MDRAYMEAVLSVLGCWRRVDCPGASGFMLGTLGDGAVVEIGDVTILGYGAVVEIGDYPLGGDVVGDLVGRYFASIYCRVLMACIFSSTTVNEDSGARLLSASARSSTD